MNRLENTDVGMDLVLAKAEIQTLRKRIEELESQLEEYHSCFGEIQYISNEQKELIYLLDN